MLQMVRIASLVTGAADRDNIFALGRMAAGISGGLFVFSASALARRAMGDVAARA
jgi:hypothetical protein